MSGFEIKNLANPLYYEENVLPPHSDHKYYGSEAELASGCSSFKYSLNGLWHIHVARNLAERPEGFEASDYDCRHWDTIAVPAHIQMKKG